MFLLKISHLLDALKMLFLFSCHNHCDNHYISPCRTNIQQFVLCFQGPKFYNSLNIEIQNDGTLCLSLNCEHYSLLILLDLLIYFLFFSYFSYPAEEYVCFECLLLLLLFNVCVPFPFKPKIF